MRKLSSAYRSIYAIVAVVVLAGAGAALNAAQSRAHAQGIPADKMYAAGSTIEIMTDSITEGSARRTAELLNGTIRTSTPTDLVFRVTAECALWTDISTIGNDDSQSLANVKVWVELDGSAVPVASGDDGQVVFCNRVYRSVTSNFDDRDAQIDTYLRTRSANAFDWITLNVGNGIHTVVVKAQLDAEVTNLGIAKAAVGKRTLTVEPVKLANDATI